MKLLETVKLEEFKRKGIFRTDYDELEFEISRVVDGGARVRAYSFRETRRVLEATSASKREFLDVMVNYVKRQCVVLGLFDSVEEINDDIVWISLLRFEKGPNVKA